MLIGFLKKIVKVLKPKSEEMTYENFTYLERKKYPVTRSDYV